jgi:NAD+ dependent glucose-6-phosphate dehydrogenase
MTLPKLLITGYAGMVGQVLWHGLADSFELYGVDLHRRVSTDNIFQADISNATEIDAVFAQIPQLSHVVHLVGDPRADADWESVLKNNIAGTRNLYEAARIHRVKRVVFASSNHVTGAYEGFPPSLHTQSNPRLIAPQDPIRPDGNYGVSKAAGEALARMYYEFYGIESVCLRIGTVLKDDDPSRDPRHASTWLSHLDLVQLVRKSLLAEVQFAIYYGVSNNSKRFWDISNAETEIDYRPESDASLYR